MRMLIVQARRQARGPLVLHPFLVAVYPVVFLFVQNLDERLAVDVLFQPLLLVLAVTAATLLLLGGVLRDYVRAGLVTTLLLALFFSYGYAWQVAGETLGSHRFLLVTWGLCAYLGVVVILRARDGLGRITGGLNAAAGLMLAFNLVPLAADQLDNNRGPAAPSGSGELIATAMSIDRTPDIYYLIFDRYGGARTLADHYDFDNSEFLETLESRGFYVARDSMANYPITNLSVASSLSMDYLDAEALRAEATTPWDYTPLYRIVGGAHPVIRFLKAHDYEFFNIATWWDLGARNTEADHTFRYERDSEFVTVLYETTALVGLAPLVLPEDADPRQIYRQHTLFQFDVLERISEAPGPKFVYMHVALPHDPYVFDRNGDYVSEYTRSSRSTEENYIEQLLYANKRILEVLDYLLAGPQGDHPVILIQADEGPQPPRIRDDYGGFQWREATRDELLHKYRILNAFYLPGQTDPGLYETISPVNSFRVVFNVYFGTELPLLPDRVFVFRDVNHPYELFDVTDRID